MRFFLICVVFLSLGFSAPALAFTAGYDQYTSNLSTSNLDALELKSDQEWGQTFQISYHGQAEVGLDQLTVFLFRATSANNKTITASLRESWNGTPVWSSTIQANTIERDNSADANTLHDAVTFYGTSVQLQTGNQYYLRLDTTASEKIYVHFNPNSSYSPGNLINKDGNNESGKDLLFAIPEPSTAVLIALGLGVMARRRPNRA
jgi:hypothetical protein